MADVGKEISRRQDQLAQLDLVCEVGKGEKFWKKTLYAAHGLDESSNGNSVRARVKKLMPRQAQLNLGGQADAVDRQREACLSMPNAAPPPELSLAEKVRAAKRPNDKVISIYTFWNCVSFQSDRTCVGRSLPRPI